jgi:hypothetical protein
MNICRRPSGDSAPSVRSGRPPARRRHVPIAALALMALASCGNPDAPSGSASTSPASQSDTTLAAAPDPTTVPTTAPTTAAPEPTATEPTIASTQPTTTLSDIAAGGYVPVDAVPALVDGASDPIEAPLPDGVYWSWEYASADDSVEFVLSQLFTGDACRQRFGAEACPSDNNTLYEPMTTITMAPGTTSVTVLVAAGGAGFDRFAVSASEFARLVDGRTPAQDAPAGFSFERHPVVIVVTGGEIESVDQVFMS